MKGLKAGFTDDQVSRLFKAADKAGNGVLSYEEFVDFLWDTKTPVGSGVPEPVAEEKESNVGMFSSGGMLRAKGNPAAAKFREPAAANPTEDEKAKVKFSIGGLFWGGQRK